MSGGSARCVYFPEGVLVVEGDRVVLVTLAGRVTVRVREVLDIEVKPARGVVLCEEKCIAPGG